MNILFSVYPAMCRIEVKATAIFLITNVWDTIHKEMNMNHYIFVILQVQHCSGYPRKPVQAGYFHELVENDAKCSQC